jgi:ribosomal protein S18 acetylase RimI-like enzyme
MTEDLVLRQYNADQTQGLVDQLVEIYLEAYADGNPFHSEDRYRRQLAGHMKRTGWTLITASVNGDMVGYIYGFPLPADTRWWEGFQGDAPAGFTDENGHRTFGLCELLVRSHWQRRGIARSLHHKLMGSRPEERATLLTRPDNDAAQAAYRRWGWQKIGELRPAWEHSPIFQVLVRQTLR